MKTDSIFFEIFQKLPRTLFELLGEPRERGEQYEFCSVEVKQTAYRIDGVFRPKLDSLEQTVLFLEVQFQKDDGLYDRMFSEIMMYLAQNPDVEDWQAIAVFPRRSIEPDKYYRHRSLLQSAQFRVVYLEDFLGLSSDQIGIQLMQLIVSKAKETDQYLQGLVQQLQRKTDSESQEIIELIGTIMVYKFPKLSCEEIEAMFTVSDLKQTKVYQEALDEGLEQGLEQGRSEEALALVLRQLNRCVGAIASKAEIQIRDLSLAQIEQLGEALLDFSDLADLDKWLQETR